MVAAAAATGILSLCGSPVYADSHADGSPSGSPGLASGNALQIPVNAPLNICGNTTNVVAALNPAFGNTCAHGSGSQASPGASAQSSTDGSPGVVSGNNVQLPVNAPTNLCGNTIDVVAALNPAFGNSCAHGPGSQAAPGAPADSSATGSPGVVSGNSAQLPVNAPVNLCGNAIGVGAVLSPVFGNSCGSGTAQQAPPTQ